MILTETLSTWNSESKIKRGSDIGFIADITEFDILVEQLQEEIQR